jgi:hypothetical protein
VNRIFSRISDELALAELNRKSDERNKKKNNLYFSCDNNGVSKIIGVGS